MELPVIGKRVDVCNKKAVMALTRHEDDVALKCWEEALSMNEVHFDTQYNYLIYKWKEANISDDELLEELGKEIFSVKNEGQIIKGTV